MVQVSIPRGTITLLRDGQVRLRRRFHSLTVKPRPDCRQGLGSRGQLPRPTITHLVHHNAVISTVSSITSSRHVLKNRPATFTAADEGRGCQVGRYRRRRDSIVGE